MLRAQQPHARPSYGAAVFAAASRAVNASFLESVENKGRPSLCDTSFWSLGLRVQRPLCLCDADKALRSQEAEKES